MKAEKVEGLAVPDSGCGDVRLTFEGLELSVEYEYAADGDWIGRLRFEDVVAFRFRKEMYSAGFVDGSYDTVVRIEDSAWLPELKRLEPSGIRDLEEKKHYAVLLSSNGYLEVIAAGMVVGERHPGALRQHGAQ